MNREVAAAPQSLADLTQPDPRTVLLLGRGDPSRAFEVVQRLIGFDLAPEVPDTVRRAFARVRLLFTYGFLQYEFFTLARQQADLLYDLALGERFVQFLGGVVELRNAAKAPHVATAPVGSLSELVSLLHPRYGKFPHREGWRVVDPTTGQPMRSWYTSVRERFDWARRAGLLPGQRSRLIFEQATISLRDRAAHPADYSYGMPNDAVIGIGDLAETINKLWGHDTPGGRRYPTALEQEVVAIGRHPEGHTTVYYRGEDLVSIPDDQRDWSFELVLGAANERLDDVDPNFEMTAYPAERLSPPISSTEARKVWLALPESKRQGMVRYQERPFLVGAVGGQVEVPRSIDAFRRLSETEGRARRWYLVQADISYDARGHVMHELESLKAGETTIGDGPCWRCAVHTWLAGGTWRQAKFAVRELEARVAARQ